MAEKKKKKIFIGVAWPYVNGDIHIGHLAGYLLPADIFARFHRLRGNDVLMASGSDCHGTPITVEAEEKGVHPRDVVEEYHAKNLKLFDELKLSFDIFTATTTENHKKIVRDFFLAGLKGGYIVKGSAKQYYSENEERFLPDRYVEGTCPYCGYEESRSDQCDKCGKLIIEGDLKNPRSKQGGNEVVLRETEHYFFDWSQLQDFLEEYFKEKSDNWRKWVKSETENWLKEGLKPRAITRDIEWGIELPVEEIRKISEDLLLDNIEGKRIYVWFEAVIGYFSASVEWSEKKWKDFWYDSPANKLEHVYFMGKDNLVFHTLFWPGQLRVYDKKLHLPDNPAINQFLNLENEKFSKSRNVTVSSGEAVRKYGLDAIRFYLTSIMPEYADTNFTWKEFAERHNGVLINTFGNFINRTLKMAKGLEIKESYLDGEIVKKSEEYAKKAENHLGKTEFRAYVESVVGLADFGNKYLSKKEPWKDKDKENKEKTLTNAVFITLMLQMISAPLLPVATEKLSDMTGVKFGSWPDDEAEEVKRILKQVNIAEPKALFDKIEI